MSPWVHAASLAKRIQFPEATSWGNAVLTERQRDSWTQAGKYGRGWVYFSLVLLAISTAIRVYQSWGDRVRIALHKEAPRNGFQSPQDEYELPSAATDSSTTLFFPAQSPLHSKQQQSSVSTVAPLNNAIALVRWIFYRSLPEIRVGRYRVVFPSLGASAIIFAALVFVTLYCFLPQPLYYSSIRIGSPPLAIRAGMLAVAMVPWIVAMSTRANFISMLTGIGHERLNVLHRWAGYICLFLSLIHTIPFYVTPVWEHGMLVYYQMNQQPQNIYVYGTGVAALVPLGFLCVHSLPILRDWMYELFLKVHLPTSLVFVAMLFWHTKNYLSSWAYLFSTLAILVLSYIVRLAYLNWTNPLRLSFMIGEDSAVTILPQDAIKVTVPTQMRWKPGQYVYLRMPRIAFFQNHPFTVASLCSNDFPSDYGEEYRDLALVFRPFRGFTKNVLRKSIEYGPFKTWTAFLEGPYGGMRRQMAAFDDVIFFAGGSGITAIASHLLDLIKKMREGKAVTKTVRVIWALRDPESIDWFKEELRICRDHAPLNTVHVHFYLTGAKDGSGHSLPVQDQQLYRDIVQEKIYDTLQEIEKRSSAYIREEAAGDEEIEKALRRENEDALTALPRAYTSNLPRSSNYTSPMSSTTSPYNQTPYQSPYQSQYTAQQPQYAQFQSPYIQQQSPYISPETPTKVPFDFGFDQSTQSQPYQPEPHFQPPLQPQSEPQTTQKPHPHLTIQTIPPAIPRPPPTLSTNQNQNPRFASLPLQKRNGWKIDYTRPDIPKMLNEFSTGFGRRTCVYVCGPPSMRMAVSDSVARLQLSVLMDSGRDEVYLHAENYNI